MSDMKISTPVIQNVETKAKEKAQNEIKATEPKKDGAKKLTLALGGLAVAGAVIAAGVLIAKKGASCKLEALKDKTKLSVEDFKKVGKFEKGFASIDGKGFTGELLSKNGTKITYENGLIQTAKNPEKCISKVYSYAKDGTKTIETAGKTVTISPNKTITTVSKFGKSDFIRGVETQKQIRYAERIKTVTPDGKISDLTYETVSVKNPKFKKGKSVAYTRVTDNLTGKSHLDKSSLDFVNSRNLNKPAPQTTYKKHNVTLPNGKKGTAICGLDGNIQSAKVGCYNPKTGTVITENYYKKGNNGELTKGSIEILDKTSGKSIIGNPTEIGNKFEFDLFTPGSGMSYKMPVYGNGDKVFSIENQYGKNMADAIQNYIQNL